MLEPHGKIDCHLCFDGPHLYNGTRQVIENDFKLVNNPGAWGSNNPTVLVLGFSKGLNANLASEGPDFEAVPFAGIRDRLTKILQVLRLPVAADVSDHINKTESFFAFGSLMRCSLSRRNPKTAEFKSEGLMDIG